MQMFAFTTEDSAGVIQAICLMLFIIFLYFLPTVGAWKKQCRDSVFVLNLFLGWTLIGWVVALAWALKDPVPKRIVGQTPLMQVGPPRLCSTCGKYSTSDSRYCSSCGLAL